MVDLKSMTMEEMAAFFKELGLDTQYIPDEPNMEDL